jgi:hypothetical protein
MLIIVAEMFYYESMPVTVFLVLAIKVLFNRGFLMK